MIRRPKAKALTVRERFKHFRNEVDPSNYGSLFGGVVAAAMAFLLAQAFFNRTLIAWLSTTAPSTDSSFTRTHQGALLGWLLTSAVGLMVDLAGSLWLAYQAFRFVWHRRPGQKLHRK